MPILIKVDLRCKSFDCKYCYQHPFKPKDEVKVDVKGVTKTITDLYNKNLASRARNLKVELKDVKIQDRPKIILHGGEPLDMDRKLIEHFLKLSFDLSGRSSIQTNGYGINDDIIGLFKKYKTGVGVSIDGPWPCNELRGSGDRENRMAQTTKVLENIDALLKAKITPGIIVVTHKFNGIGDRREILKQWIKRLYEKRITGRLNPCCCGNPEIDFTGEEAVDFYIDMLEFFTKNGISGWDPYGSMMNSLLGQKRVECKFSECDPFCTGSAVSVLHDATVGVCLRLYGDGKTYERHQHRSRVRSRVLSEYDCKECPWWHNCYGGCSQTAVDFDWRNKDRFCMAWKAIYPRLVNIFKFARVPKPKTVRPPKIGATTGDNHTDGIEHLDDGWRHLDSRIGENLEEFQ